MVLSAGSASGRSDARSGLPGTPRRRRHAARNCGSSAPYQSRKGDEGFGVVPRWWAAPPAPASARTVRREIACRSPSELEPSHLGPGLTGSSSIFALDWRASNTTGLRCDVDQDAVGLRALVCAAAARLAVTWSSDSTNAARAGSVSWRRDEAKSTFAGGRVAQRARDVLRQRSRSRQVERSRVRSATVRACFKASASPSAQSITIADPFALLPIVSIFRDRRLNGMAVSRPPGAPR
jgi:hypothetical protein